MFLGDSGQRVLFPAHSEVFDSPEQRGYSICKRFAVLVKCCSSVKAAKKCKCLSFIYAPEIGICRQMFIASVFKLPEAHSFEMLTAWARDTVAHQVVG